MAKRKLSAAARAALEQNAKIRLLKAASLPVAEALKQYDVTQQGHKAGEVENLRDAMGENIITKQRKQSPLGRLFKAFINPFTLVLFVLAVIGLTTVAKKLYVRRYGELL